MSSQPKLEKSCSETKQIRSDIKQLKNDIIAEAKKDLKKDKSNSSKQKLNQLNTEFKKLAQLRLNQSHSLQDQWESYQTDTRQSRKKDIEKRQADFDKETQMDQIKNEEPIKKSEICSRLIHVLKNQDSIQIVNQNSDNGDIDTSVVILPNDILELFWFIGVNDIPVVQSELPLMISRLESLLK